MFLFFQGILNLHKSHFRYNRHILLQVCKSLSIVTIISYFWFCECEKDVKAGWFFLPLAGFDITFPLALQK